MKKNKFESNEQYYTIFIYAILVILIGCIIFRVVFHWNSTIGIIKKFFSNMSSFVIGILIAFMVNPLVNRLYKLMTGSRGLKNIRLAKFLSIFLAYLVVLIFIGLCLVYIIPQLISSISDISGRIPGMYYMFSAWLRKTAYNNRFLNDTLVNQYINKLTPKIFDFSTILASKLIPFLYSASIAVISWFLTILIALVVSIYLLTDKRIIFHGIKRILYAFLPDDTAGSVIEIAKNCNRIFTGYIVAKSIDSLIIGVLCFFIMSILQLPYTVLISVIVGITNMIPYFGPYIGAVPGILVLGVLKVKYGIIFGIMIFILQQFDGLVLGPRLLGDSTGLRPILILFAITLGGSYAGVLGMFLGVPVMAVIQYLFDLLIRKKLRQKQIKV
ncbi:MAG: AI-2E family transporter [Eubacterium sp.]|nr:AI-2E family transporter [Eubacterium sp.]